MLPVVLQCVLIGELVAAELQGDLKAVAAEVVEILHSCIVTVTEKREKKSQSFLLGKTIHTHISTRLWEEVRARGLTSRHTVPGPSVSDAVFEAGLIVVAAGGSLWV